MSPGRPTLLDVARRAGVSRTTASFVLTGRRDMRISAEAEQRVRQAARELSYRPNLMARALRTRLTHTIGLVSDTIATEAFAGEMVRGAVATALLHEHLLFIGETEGDAAVEKRVVQDMLDRGVDGFLYAAMYTRHARPPAVLRRHPVVMLNCLPADPRTTAVVPDELDAGRTAARALLEAGHAEHIYLVGETPPEVYAGTQRLAGIRECLSQQGTALAGSVDCLWWPEPAYAAVRQLLAEDHRPSALICLNDRVAFGAYQALQEAGLSIPVDVSVVSFDDSDLASWLRPQLSSVALPHLELGRRAVELLLAEHLDGGVEHVRMPLRDRASVAAPAARRGGTRAGRPHR
ncbi:MAG TPA: LacI family DNA-binding transcriptional regulator [Micromonosporaceae bacterium]|nr:LacI family DNA-binding transcriptional regulator [Micromonosporaceae bacterium]